MRRDNFETPKSLANYCNNLKAARNFWQPTIDSAEISTHTKSWATEIDCQFEWLPEQCWCAPISNALYCSFHWNVQCATIHKYPHQYAMEVKLERQTILMYLFYTRIHINFVFQYTLRVVDHQCPWTNQPTNQPSNHSSMQKRNDLFLVDIQYDETRLNRFIGTYLTFGNCAAVVPIFHSTFSISDDILPLIMSLLWCILINFATLLQLTPISFLFLSRFEFDSCLLCLFSFLLWCYFQILWIEWTLNHSDSHENISLKINTNFHVFPFIQGFVFVTTKFFACIWYLLWFIVIMCGCLFLSTNCRSFCMRVFYDDKKRTNKQTNRDKRISRIYIVKCRFHVPATFLFTRFTISIWSNHKCV